MGAQLPQRVLVDAGDGRIMLDGGLRRHMLDDT
jgi:hypothetical protein